MPLFKKNPFGHILYIKKWLIRILGTYTHRRYRGFNELKIEGSEIIRELKDESLSLKNEKKKSFNLDK